MRDDDNVEGTTAEPSTEKTRLHQAISETKAAKARRRQVIAEENAAEAENRQSGLIEKSTSPIQVVRFWDLKDAQIVNDWRQLKRLQDEFDFPAGYLLGPNTRVWDLDDIKRWLQSRREAARHRAA